MSQYGPQGAPVKIPATTPTEPAAAAVRPEEVPAPAAQQALAEPEPAGAPLTPEERAAHKEALAAANHQRAEIAEARLRSAAALLTEWEQRAESTLIRSDYQKGQRDATLRCVGDLREKMGL